MYAVSQDVFDGFTTCPDKSRCVGSTCVTGVQVALVDALQSAPHFILL